MRSILFIALLIVTTHLRAATIHVPADQPTIQAGINFASNGDTVLVGNGLFSGPGNVDISPMGKAIQIISSEGPDMCIIEINSQGGGSVGFHCNSGEDTSTTISGFTIRAVGVAACGIIVEQSSILLRDCRFLGCYNPLGGALHVKNGMVTAQDCRFFKNGARFGGVAYLDSAFAEFTTCVIDSNSVGSLNSAYGGAVWAGPGSNVLIQSTVFTNNFATYQQPPGDTRGAAIYCGEGAQVVIDSSVFEGNIAFYGMGGAIFADQADITITNSVFDSNGHRNLPPLVSMGGEPSTSAAINPKSFASGGAIYAMLSDLTVSNCVFSTNQPPYVQGLATKYRGGAICSDRCTTLVSGSTFVDNAARTGYAIFAFESILKIDSSIIAFNREIYPGQGAPVACDTFSNVSVSVTCTDIYGNPNGNWLELVDSLEMLYNNFSLDPQFCGRSVGNYHLQEDSPCRPEFSPCGSLVGALPVEPGCNSCCEGTTGNANLAGSVDLSDLSLLISYLTSTPQPLIPCPEEANVNTSGTIDLSDLSALIAFITDGSYSLPWCP